VNESDLRAQLSLALGGRYILERELETTGRSRLFLARDDEQDREVVVKVLPDAVTTGVSPDRFAREIRYMSALQEPHTVPIFSTGFTAGGSIFYTMPYIKERSLGHRLEEAPLSFDEAIVALRDLARAMKHAHALGIVHGDIKPENVFLIKGGAVITDFGVATALEAARYDSEERGHLRLITSSASATAYIAPEHVSAAHEVDHRADIYAWGVMAYELLYDVHPFPDVNTVGELLEAHLTAAPPVPQHKAFGVPEQLATLVMRCLAKDPAERPASAGELLDVLDRIPSGAAALAVESWSPARLIGMALLAFAAFLSLATAIWRLQSDPPEIPLVAVLPFEMSGAPGDSLFAEAVVNGVAAKLKRFDIIRVVDYVSTQSHPAAVSGAWGIGKSLGAQYVLRTTMRWFRDVDGSLRAQLSPTLIDVSDGSTKWAGQPELAFPGDPYTPQSSIATQAARELGVQIGATQKTVLAERSTEDTAAYAAFVRGDALYRRGLQLTPEVPVAARYEFERAFTLDPLFADALGSWASLRSMEAMHSGSPELLDSISRAARRAIAVQPMQTRALIAAARVDLLEDRIPEALDAVSRALDGNPSSVEALQLRCDLLLLVGDTTAVWRDVQRIVRLAPRSPNSLLGAARTALALRRVTDAREFLRRARALQPTRTDLIFAAAHLAQATGNIPEMIRLVSEARSLGGTPTVDDVSLLRAGDTDMQDEFAHSRPGDFSVTSADDSLMFYREKAKLFIARRDSVHLRPALDSADVALKSAMHNRSTSEQRRRALGEYSGWIDAASGNRARMYAAMATNVPAVNLQRYANGSFAAFVACNDAELYALGGDLETMLQLLERCLTLPGGYLPNALRDEPALARYARDPRLGAVFGRLGLDLDRQ
jgi:serine/threonine protein kinase/tetratricopeptide (TPR) repeat protein